MTFSQCAVEAAIETYAANDPHTILIDGNAMRAALTAALDVDGLMLQGWQPIESAPKDTFILLYCPEDGSRWLAKWQSEVWLGIDECGLSRNGHSAGDARYVTGWFVTHWMPLPPPPAASAGEDSPPAGTEG